MANDGELGKTSPEPPLPTSWKPPLGSPTGAEVLPPYPGLPAGPSAIWPPMDLIGSEATDPFAHPSASIVRTATAVVAHGLIYPAEEVLYSVAACTTTALTATTGPAGDCQLRKLAVQDFEDAKPCPNALFCPRIMKWIIWEAANEFLTHHPKESQTPALPLSLALYESGELQSIAAGEQKKPIKVSTMAVEHSEKTLCPSQKRTSAFFEYPYRMHYDVARRIHYVSAQVPSSIDPSWLASIKAERKANPPPGQSGDDTFLAAIKVLVRILTNASRSDTRSLPLSSQTIRNKLIYDDPMARVLAACGMVKTTVDDDGNAEAEALRASPHDQDLTLRNLLEIVAWWDFYRPSSSHTLDTELVGFSIRLDRVDPYDFACALLDWRNQHVPNQSTPHAASVDESMRLLGVTERCDDATIERVYYINKCRKPDAIYHLFSAIETIWRQERPQSDRLAILVAKERSRGLFTTDDVRQAYRVLGMDVEAAMQGSTSNETVRHTHYVERGKAAQDQRFEDVRRIHDSLRIITRYRGMAPDLVDVAAEEIEMNLEQAYQTLNMESTTDDEMVAAAYACYQNDFGDDAAKLATFHDAVSVIARHRQSHMLKSLVTSGDATAGPADALGLGSANVPTGLNNIGNTCYLNSVLQYFFALRPLRDAVLKQRWEVFATEIHETDVITTQMAAREQRYSVGGRLVSPYEIERSRKFAAHLAQLFDAMITSLAAAVTPERELAYLALVSARAEEIEEQQGIGGAIVTPSKQAKVHNIPGMDPNKKVQSKWAESSDGDTSNTNESLGDASAKRPRTTPPPVPLRPIRAEFSQQSERRNSLMRLGAQQDVSECLDNVLFQIEVALGSTHGNPDDARNAVIDAAKLFTGKTRQQVSRGAGSTPAVKEEIFTILPIEVLEEEGRDIYDGLDGFFDSEVLQMATPGSASSSTSYTDGEAAVERTVTLIDPPPVLQIQLQRVQFDRVRGVFKSQAHLSAPEELYLDRYLDPAVTTPGLDTLAREKKRAKAADLRRQINKLRDAVARLTTDEGGKRRPVPEVLRKTASALASLSSNQDQLAIGGAPGLTEFLREEAQSVGSEIKQCLSAAAALKRESERLWEPKDQEIKYRLMSVFMHRGEATHGHYFLNQRRCSQNDAVLERSKWYKYNDSVVSAVEVDDVLQDKTGATPYLLSYVRVQEEEPNIFETLHRNLGGGRAGGIVITDGTCGTELPADEGSGAKT